MLFFDTPHHHAHMSSFNYNPNTLCTGHIHYFLSNLRKSFLYLEPTRIKVNDSTVCSVQSGGLGPRTDMANPEERQDMVLAQAVQLDVPR